MSTVRCSLSFTLLMLAPVVALGQSVDEIRDRWQTLRRFDSLPSGEWLTVAADDYSGRESTAPADPERAAELAKLAYRAAELGEAALAIRIATEAVDADPDCEPARLALGYEQHEGDWLTPYGVRMAKRGLEWNATYGWIAPEDLPRYENGERRMRRRWVSAEVDARTHDPIEQGWQVRTDHFNVTTNHSLEAGVQLAAKLEQLYQVWLQLFADFAIDQGELRDRFEKHRVPGIRSRPYQVVFHRNRDQYNQALANRQARIGETIGIYFDHQREAHFFYTKEFPIDATLFHESVHQLFQESDVARRDPALDENFWAIEGVACWFESLTTQPAEQGQRLFTIGTAQAGRLPAARRRLLEEGYRIPLAELVALGKRDLQARNDLAALYSQAAGLASYWMATPQRQRAFVDYLRQIYAGKADAATLAKLSGDSFSELDTDYREYLRKLPAP